MPGVSILTVPLTSNYTVSFLLLTLRVCISVGKRAIRALPVKCDNVERGCELEVTVGTLDEHVALCKFTPVPCPHHCKEKYKITLHMRKDLDHHVNNECPNREYKCEYCGEKGTCAYVTKIHDNVCEKKKIPCTNTKCTKSIERGKMKLHLNNDCDYTIIPCKYKKIGCDVEARRKDMPVHEENESIHLHRAITTVVKLQDNLQSAKDTIAALRGEVATLQGDTKSAKDTIATWLGEVAMLQHELITLQQYNMKSANDTITALQGEVATLQGDMKLALNTLQTVTRKEKPLTFKLTKCQKKKDNNEMTKSPSVYTSPEGYHVALIVYANGNNYGNHTHVSAYVKILKGKHDNTLKWPFTGTYCIELLNQLEDKNHHTVTINIGSEYEQSVGSSQSFHKFIPHPKLSHDPSNNTQYLKDDTLYFRLTVIPSDHKPWLDQYC